MSEAKWHELGLVSELEKIPIQQLSAGKTKIALIFHDGEFSAISGVCNHVGGPLGNGRLDGDYVVCPWHNWKFHRKSGLGEPGYEEDAVPTYELKIENDRLFVNLSPITPRTSKKHERHPLARPVSRSAGTIRVVGISTTVMDAANPRYSTSDALLDYAMEHAQSQLGAATQTVRLNDLKFRACEGYYSKSSHACTWPCSITQMDPKDQLDRVYEAIVHWADVILVSTPIRWGSASSLYYKMIERMNCIQNQITISNKVLMHNKVAAFIITGGQDNVQAVAGQMLGFFAELGCHLPPFPYIAHSRGWSAEDMERNVEYVADSKTLREGAADLVARSINVAKVLIASEATQPKTVRGGRKAHQLDVRAQT